MLLGPFSLFGQQQQGATDPGSLRVRYFSISNARFRLDSLTIVPPLYLTDSASGRLVPDSFFSLKNQILTLDTSRIKTYNYTTLRAEYRVLPFDLSAAVRRLDTLNIRKNNAVQNDIVFDYSPYQPQNRPWESAGLRSSGAYVRGLSFGNSQNLVFNSNLNLQLDGKLGDDLELRAALSDNTIPLQPDGTTRQLQEFDRIFIQLKRKNTVLTAGDFDLAKPNSWFANYFKRLQGGMFTLLPATDNSGWSGSVAAAITRGKFARQTIAGQEGNQGPYRLQGAEGERFIIVLAGTEKVFIDGMLQQRGLDADYTVDYNLAEVSFTPRRLITKDSRIIIEFEYATQTYLRSTLAAGAEYKRRKTRAYLNLYSEQDGRSSGGAGELSANERQTLAQAGDQLRNAVASGIDTLAEFDPSRVLYRIVDSIICGQPYPVLIYSTNRDSARYAARFSEVPANQGHYVLAQTAANGRVYRFVPPDPTSCQLQGNFEPVIRLTAPEQRQLFTGGIETTAFKGGQVHAEAAVSARDYNRFSPLNDGDNTGAALMVKWQQPLWFISAKKGNSTQFYTQYEHTTRRFQALNPYRPAEFVRDWNTQGLAQDTVAENLARAGLQWKHSTWGAAQYEFGGFRRNGVYDGTRHFGKIQLQQKGWNMMAEVNLLSSAGNYEKSRFSRPKFDLSKTFFTKDTATRKAIFKAGIYAEREKNQRNNAGADTLNRLSFWYDLARFYLQIPEHQGRWQWLASVSQRNDYAPDGSAFTQNTAAREWSLNGAWTSQQPGIAPRSISHQLNWLFTRRDLKVITQELTTEKTQNNYLGRMDYALNAWRGAVNLTTGYELGSGQSPRLEFNYLLVNPGEGNFTWIDRNRDSILQVDEMEIALFQDQANYVRVAVTTTEYVRTNNVILNQNLRFEPRSLWPTARKGWRKWLGRLATQNTLQINRRTYAGAAHVSAWNPFQFDIADTALVTVSASLRHALFINRAQPLWDMSLTNNDLRSQLALTTGFEQRRNQDWVWHGRFNFNPKWSIENDLTRARRESDNEAFNNRDFDINSWQMLPKITWLPVRYFRAAMFLKWKNSANQLGNLETSNQTDLNTEITWNPPGKTNAQGFKAATSMRLKLTQANIRYTGEANTAVAFTMLEGLQNGRNYLWNLQLDRQLSKTLQMNIQYEGRKTGDNRTVHVARAQVRAVF